MRITRLFFYAALFVFSASIIAQNADRKFKKIVENAAGGIFQIASFHPYYCFAETDPDSVENLTNRAPYPILHIIREQSLEKALEKMMSPDEIFKRNIQTINELSTEQIKSLFPYLAD